MMIDMSRHGSAEIEQLLEQMEAGLDRGEIPQRIFGDPEIWRLELRRVFARCWIFVGHETEIPQPGDYVSRAIADTPVIVTRDDEGAIHVLLDSCRHRGVRLCRGDKGSAAHFTCAYHGWTYRSDGRLIGVPNYAEAYGTSLKMDDWGLIRVRSASYQGLIFACIDPQTPSFEEYLGDFRWYVDVHFGLAPEGLEVVGAPIRWVLATNWKTGSENFAGDSYHTTMLHRSLSLAGIAPPFQPQSPYNVHVTECSGHAASIARVAPGERLFWGAGPDYERFYRGSALSAEQLDLARRSLNGQATIFPNFGLVHGPQSDELGGPPAPCFTISVLQPKSPTTVEMLRWALVPKAASREEKERIRRVTFGNHGLLGMVEQDDSSVWGGIAVGGASTAAAVLNVKLNYGMGMGTSSAGTARVVEDFPGPGLVFDTRLEDGTSKTILRRWAVCMRTP